ncbi:hypothetical protein NC653_016853 [Populus alba x Populus x berolinensis]|uniref:Uncharacterized protein n=1 Tax=Populus alba x Populus x berolinensis TaxID=444605 RepID=A0AAD6VZR3_9ROSI|nr:hypothetical protein NC653_016847 [Populus alba x Populus x berolinensis]KAJ6993855.1 hypothetical protein NC653_016853 [Populus alba x Populus x berolinensis]
MNIIMWNVYRRTRNLMVEPVLKREIMFFIEDVIFSKVE